MVAKMISGKDIKGALNYNEQKVLQGKATCIQANLFLKEVEQLTFYDKLNRFKNLNNKNKRTRTNTLHISLNFAPGERLDADKLNRIASTYMDRIGFGRQPFLVYEHTDAAHPHVHIVTTLIRDNGKRIPIHYVGKNQSEVARKEIEKDFGLIQAGGRIKKEMIQPIDVSKAVYGKSQTRRSIMNIVKVVTRSYKYTSLPELNAALRQFNVTADRGTERSRMFANRGLLYSLIDEKGKRIGIPVKASSIYGKPTLAWLEKQFKLNEALRQPFKDSLKRTIDTSLQSPRVTTPKLFSEMLRSQGIAVVFRTNAEGRTYGVTFVDNRTRVIFNGSDLGKAYSARSIQDRLSANTEMVQTFRPNSSQAESLRAPDLLHDLFMAENLDHSSPEAALRLRRKKRRRGRKL